MSVCLHNFLGESMCEPCGMTETQYANEWAQEEFEKGKAEGAAEERGWTRSDVVELAIRRTIKASEKA